MGILDYLIRIINLLGQVLNGTLTIQQAVQRLLDSIEKVALEHAPYRIETVTLSTNLETIDPDHGLAAIKRVVDAISAGQIALGNPQQASQPVTLPTVPPAGYGGASAAAVWSYVLSSSGATTANQLDNAGMYAVALADRPWPRLPGQPYLKLIVHFNWIGVGFYVPDPRPALDITTILQTDATPEAWVLREYASYGWLTVNQSGDWQPIAYHDLSTSNVYFALDMSQADFMAIKALLYPFPAPVLSPVWPGIAGVSLLTPFGLADGLIITEAMDGVLVAITSVTSRTQLNPYGTVQSYGHIGALSFASDEGDQEDFQYLTFANQVYSPRSMKQAASVAFRVKPGIVGTVTPWTLI